MADIPHIEVSLEADDKLSYRPDIKGSRWRSGFRDIGAVCKDADTAVGEHYFIDYVTRT